ncbi:glycoside hydrolase family 55 protein [Methylobacter psychrophilus]|uniref:glycoside hydrolase family 55 protein n=1 Tax=Methylobacter psychrophilus TaxID=96941 RepID=UPI0021D4F83A|nr:glycoside hydrolase family 55 protein [Methylobacter psychrophilus]
MNHNQLILLTLALLAVATNSPVTAAPLPCEVKLAKAAIPKNVYFLPESKAAQLQTTLTNKVSVRLKPGGDYRKLLSIKLTSNQALYGLAGTKLPLVIIPAGTSNALLSGVSPVNISFQGSTKPIKNNCFNRISNSKIIANNVLLENNLFTDLSNVAIASDTSQTGYLKNNRFIRTMVHAQYPSINIAGNINKQSQGNVFIWTNILTPHGDGIIINNQKNIRFIGIDAESWNWNQVALYPGMMNIANTDFLSVFMANGGDNYHKTGQYFNLDTSNIVLQGMAISATQNPGIILGNAVENMVTIAIRSIGLDQFNMSTQIIDIDKDYKKLITINAQTIEPENITDAAKNTLADLLQIDKDNYNTWQKPVFSAIPDPAGENWQTNITSKPDSTDAIQALIDNNGIAELNAGIYYISKPLLLNAGQGIIGAGADKTVIIAKSPTIDLIAGANHLDVKTTTTTFVLADLTLQGGFNGINHSAEGSGKGADYVMTTLSHVTIRNMANAGILIDNIYAWDNNFIDHSNFYRCKTGIQQRPDPAYIGGDQLGMTFLDKNVFYQTQFIENDIAIDMQAKRANNLNAFINSQFKNNQQNLIIKNSNSTFFANSVFETASTQPLLVGNNLTGFVNSSFTNNQPDSPLFNGGVYCNACSFNNSTANTEVIVAPTSKNSYFVNSTLSNPTPQTMDTGVVVNSNFTNDATTPVINSLFINKIAKPF